MCVSWLVNKRPDSKHLHCFLLSQMSTVTSVLTALSQHVLQDHQGRDLFPPYLTIFSYVLTPNAFIHIHALCVLTSLNDCSCLSFPLTQAIAFRGASLVTQRLKLLPAMWETWVQSLGREDPLDKEMAIHPSILAWRIPWVEELWSSPSQWLILCPRIHLFPALPVFPTSMS